MVLTSPPDRVKLIGSKGQGRCPGGYLASKVFVLKGPDRDVRHVHLLKDAKANKGDMAVLWLCNILTFDPAQKCYSKVMHRKEVTHSNSQ